MNDNPDSTQPQNTLAPCPIKDEGEETEKLGLSRELLEKPEPSSDIEKVQGPMELSVLLDQIEQRAREHSEAIIERRSDADIQGITDRIALMKALLRAIEWVDGELSTAIEQRAFQSELAQLLNAPSVPERVSSPEEEEKEESLGDTEGRPHKTTVQGQI